MVVSYRARLSLPQSVRRCKTRPNAINHPVSSPVLPSTYAFDTPDSSLKSHGQKLPGDVTSSADEGNAIRVLADILVDEEGMDFVSSLNRKDAECCIDILDLVSLDPSSIPCLTWFRQGIAGGSLKTTVEKQAFLVLLMKLAAIHGKFPESMMIPGGIEVGKEILASGGFADVRSGTYRGHLVAVKTLRASVFDDLQRIRKVSTSNIASYSCS